MNTSIQKILIYSVQISDTRTPIFQTELHKLGKSALFELPNPKYHKLRNNHQHLKGLEISDNESFYPFILY